MTNPFETKKPTEILRDSGIHDLKIGEAAPVDTSSFLGGRRLLGGLLSNMTPKRFSTRQEARGSSIIWVRRTA